MQTKRRFFAKLRSEACVWCVGLFGLFAINLSALPTWCEPSVGQEASALSAPVKESSPNSAANLLTLPLSLLWRTDASGIDQNPQYPLYSDGVLYFSAGRNICAEKATDGSTIWTYSGGGAFSESPAIAGDAIFASSDDHDIYKIDLKNGSLIWKQSVGVDIRTSPVVANSHIYFGGQDGKIYSLDADSGSLKWSYQAGGALSTPLTILDNGDVLFAAGDDALHCIDGNTGQQKWYVQFEDDPSDSPPVYNNGTIYVGAGSTLYALSPRHGVELWRSRFHSDVSSPCTVLGRDLFVTTDDGKMTLLGDRGMLIWSVQLPSHSTTQALAIGNTVLAAGEHGVLSAYAIDSGMLQWQYALQSTKNVRAMSVFADGNLYTLGSDGSLCAFRQQAPDQDGPIISIDFPKPQSTFTGSGLNFAASVVDEGSGVRPDSVSLTVDGIVQNSVYYSVAQSGIACDSTKLAGGASLVALADGTHTAELTAMDWKGNKTTQTWSFSVDNGATTLAAQAANLPSWTRDPNYPYPVPSSNPAERWQQRQEAQSTYSQLMREHQMGGPMPPAPPPY